MIEAERPDRFAGRVKILAGDLSAPGEAAGAVARRPDVIFHLAGVVSGEAELDFDKGYRVNLDGTRALLEAIRSTGDGYRPKVVYTSSIAVFGAPFPAAIPDDFHLTPLTSYGTQKAIGEALLADYARRGLCDGVGIRLPTIVVRPGRPNRAASGFFSGIIREPLAGLEAVLPVADTVLHTHASPRSAVGFLVHAAGLSREALGARVNLSMPGVCCTVAEQIAALRRVAGERVAGRIRREPDALIERIVAGWPQRIEARRARELGFKAERLVRRDRAHSHRRGPRRHLRALAGWDGLTNGCSRTPCPQLAEPDVRRPKRRSGLTQLGIGRPQQTWSRSHSRPS